MKAIVYDHYGSPDVLKYEEIENPVPADDQVLIRVCAASVNPYDWHFMRGSPAPIRMFLGLRAPKSRRLGADVAGVVEAVGRNVTIFKAGDRVFGTARGAFAEFACAPQHALALKPENLTWAQAASVPIAGITALQGLRDKGKVLPGQRVLINGAAGGVGTFAVQIAKSLGASVTAVCSARNAELVRSIGADDVVDYSLQDFAQKSGHYDVFFDLVGNRPLSACLGVLKPNGIYVACGGGSPAQSAPEFFGSMLHSLLRRFLTSRKMPGLLARVRTADLNFLADLMQSGKVTPVLDRQYALAETADAVRYVEQQHARGKVVISVP
jgi:NADPH:quinone reductase-like Zn-dependent oxidoreductase